LWFNAQFSLLCLNVQLFGCNNYKHLCLVRCAMLANLGKFNCKFIISEKLQYF